MQQYTEKMRFYPMDAIEFRNFIFQGKALFSTKDKDGCEMTFTVKSLPKRRKDPENLQKFNVELKSLNGVYQMSRFIGQIDRNRRKFIRCNTAYPDDPAILTIKGILENWENLDKQDLVSFYHRGKCCRCCRELTDSISIEQAMGKYCLHTREKKTFELIAELGIDTKGLTYVQMVHKALEKDPMLYSQLYIPNSIRKEENVNFFNTDFFSLKVF